MLTRQQAATFADQTTLYEATLEVNPRCWLCHTNLAELELRNRDADRDALNRAAERLQLALSIEPKNAEARNNLGVALQKLGRTAEAREQYRLAVELHPGYADAWSNACAVERVIGDLQSSIEKCEAALRLAPDSADALMNYGRTLLAAARPGDAARALERAATGRPDDVEATGLLGVAYERQGRWDLAVRSYQDVANRWPSAVAFEQLGFALLRTRRPAEARAALAEAVRLEPDRSSAHLALGDALSDLGEMKAAESEYRLALRDSRSSFLARVHNNLGIVLAEQKQFEEAKSHFAVALQLDPSFREAAENLRRLRR